MKPRIIALLPDTPRSKDNQNNKTLCPLRIKMNENLFASFATPTIIGLPIVILIIIFPSILFPSPKRYQKFFSIPKTINPTANEYIPLL